MSFPAEGTPAAKVIKARRSSSHNRWPNDKDGSSEIDHETQVCVLQDRNVHTKEAHCEGSSLLLHTTGVLEVKVTACLGLRHTTGVIEVRVSESH